MVKTVLLLHGVQVPSLLGELRAHMPHRTAKGEKKRKKKYLTSKMGFSIVKFKTSSPGWSTFFRTILAIEEAIAHLKRRLQFSMKTYGPRQKHIYIHEMKEII